MNPKIKFGLDFMKIMIEVDRISDQGWNKQTYVFSLFLLMWEWDFNIHEIGEVREIYAKFIETNNYDKFSEIRNRMTNYLKNNNKISARFITDMIMVNMLDSFLTDEEVKLTVSFANDLGFEQTDLDKLYSIAESRKLAMKFLVKNLELINVN